MENGINLMKSSCVTSPANESIAIAREWQVKFCNGDFFAALILNYFMYWHNYCLARSDKAKKENEVAALHGLPPKANEGLLQFHSIDEIKEGILNACGRNKIINAIQLLEEKGAISIHSNPNPRLKFDKTKFYQFHPEVCQYFIDNGKYINSDNVQLTQLKNKQMINKYNNSEENTNNINNVSNQNIDVPIRAIDNPDLNNREFKNKQPSFKSNKTYNDKEITTETTKKAAAKKIKVLEKGGEEEKQEGQKTPNQIICHLKTNLVKGEQSAAAFSFSENSDFGFIDGVIGQSLNDAQKHYLQERTNSILHLFDLSARELCTAIQAELLNKNSFKVSEQQFMKKVNIIFKQAKKHVWDPMSILQALKQSQIKDKQESMASELVELNAIRSRMYSEVTGLKVLLTQNKNDTLQAQYETQYQMLQKLTRQINALEAKLYAESA